MNNTSQINEVEMWKKRKEVAIPPTYQNNNL